MKRPQRRARRLSFRKEESALRAIVRELGPMDPDGLPRDEYDCLVHHLLSALHKGAARDEVGLEAEFHLREHFGFDARVSSRTAEQIARATWAWWSNRSTARHTDA